MTDAATRIAGLDDTQLHALHKRLDAQGIEDAAIVEAHHLVTIEMLKRDLQHGHEDDSWASTVIVMEKAYVDGPDEIEAPVGLEKAWEDALAQGGTVSIILTTDGYVLKADPGTSEVHVDAVMGADGKKRRKKGLLPAPLVEAATVEKMIRRKGDKWVVFNEDGTREFGTYDTEEEAHHRLAQMEFFKKAAKVCPPATQDVAINLKNRAKAIKVADYGPMNPNDANTEYWQEIAAEWDVPVDEAKKQRCGNCAAFNVTKEMKQCIADGIGGEEPWDVIDAGELGYCEVFKFKCAGARTCDAWIVGGPLREIEKAAEEDFDEEEFLSVLTDEDKAWYGDIAQILEEGGDPDMVMEKAGGNPEALRDYWRGGGKGKISWGAGGDFTSCVAAVSKYMSSEQAKGYCAIRHRETTGMWPGDKRNRPNMGKSIFTLPDGATYTYSIPMGSVWAEATDVLKHPGHGDQSVHGHGGGHSAATVSYDPKTGPSNADKIKNAATMYGHGSKQHEEAVRRFGAMPADVKGKVKQNLSKGSIAESYGTSHAAGKEAARIDKGNALDNATERIAKRDALVPALKQATPRSFEGENTAFAIADHQGFIDGVSGVKPQMTTSHSFSDTVAGFMFGGLAGAEKSLEIVEKHPGHPDQKVHGGAGGYQATSNRREDAMLAGKTKREVPRGADGKVINPDATGGYKAGIPESIDFGGETLTPEHSLWHHLESDGAGGYRVTEARAAVHRKVVEDATAGVPKSDDPTFYMLGGGPAAGKSTAVKSGLAGTPDKTKAVQINADDAKSALPEFERMRMSENDNDFFTAAAFAHEESSYLAKSIQKTAVKNGQDVVLDGTGDSKYESLSKKVGEARGAGYKVVGIYATVPTNIAVRRANQRSLKESERRFVPEAVVRGTHRDVSRVFPKAVREGLFDNARLIDTTDTKAVLIGETVKGGWVVQDRSRYNDFVAKGEE